MGHKVKISNYIAQYLVESGISKCFSVTGGGAMHLNDSLGHHPEIQTYYCHHEQACAMAAEGYTRIANCPAIVCVTSGPGAANAITGVLGAWLDSIPMIVVSGQMKRQTTIQSTCIPLRQLGFQEYDVISGVKHITKYAEMICDPKYVSYHIEKACFLAQHGRKGPVWLDIPVDIQGAIIDLDEMIHFDFGIGDHMNIGFQSNGSNLIIKVIDHINKSQRPVLMVGYGVRMSDGYADLLKAIELLKIPVVTEWNSNDLIPNDHAYFAGRPGTIGDRGGNIVLQNSDCILAIGCQFSIRQISYAWEKFAPCAFKIAVNDDKYENIKPTIKIDFPIFWSVRNFLQGITRSKIKIKDRQFSKWRNWSKMINEKYPVVNHSQLVKSNPVSVYGFMGTLSSCLSHNDTVVLANGAACVVGLQALQIKSGQRVFTNAGASSMGYGIAAAIGACVALKSEQRCICIEGDGSIQMNIQELQTIVHNSWNIKIFWINNGGYHSIRQTQNGMFDGKTKGYCGADHTSGISFPDAEKIALAYGFQFYRIDQSSEMQKTIKHLLDSDLATICEVVTDPDEDFQPKLQSKMLEDGSFVTSSLEDMYPFLSEKEREGNRFSP